MINDVLDVLSKYGICSVRDGYDALPKNHCFAVWTIAHRKAMGADGYAFYWLVTYTLHIYYRNGKTEEDSRIEKVIESELRGLDNLESEYDYDSKDSTNVTSYSFTADEDF